MRAAFTTWLRWTASFVAFPLGGVAGGLVVGPVSTAIAALLGGLVTGTVIGLGQSLLSARRLRVVRWTVASAVGSGVGLLVGATVVGFGTSLGQLAAMGAVTGLGLGAAQTAVLPVRGPRRWLWLPALAVLWALGWTVTTLTGVEVSRQFTVFGASGAVTVSALTGQLLGYLVPRPSPAQHAEATSVAAGERS